jgi:hypothetical protein
MLCRFCDDSFDPDPNAEGAQIHCPRDACREAAVAYAKEIAVAS